VPRAGQEPGAVFPARRPPAAARPRGAHRWGWRALTVDVRIGERPKANTPLTIERARARLSTDDAPAHTRTRGAVSLLSRAVICERGDVHTREARRERS
jgi:hypothetical protein